MEPALQLALLHAVCGFTFYGRAPGLSHNGDIGGAHAIRRKRILVALCFQGILGEGLSFATNFARSENPEDLHSGEEKHRV